MVQLYQYTHTLTHTHTMSERVTGDGLAAETTHHKGLLGRLEGRIKLLSLSIKQSPAMQNTHSNV